MLNGFTAVGASAVGISKFGATTANGESESKDDFPEPTGATRLSSDSEHEYVGFKFDDAYAIVRARRPDRGQAGSRTNVGAQGKEIGVRVFEGTTAQSDVQSQIQPKSLPYPDAVERWSSFAGEGGECQIVPATHAYAGAAIKFDSFWKDIGEVGIASIIGYILSTVLSAGYSAIATAIAGTLLVLGGDKFTFGTRDVDRCFNECRLFEDRAGRSYNPNPSYGKFVDVTLPNDAEPGHISEDVLI